MAEEYCYPLSRKTLGDYYEMTWRCAKCGYCRNVFPSDTEHERFARQCPAGDRFKFESYFAAGRNELARRTIEGKQALTSRMRHILYTCTTCNACEEWCEATQGLYPLRITRAMREHFIQNQGELLPEHRQLCDNIKRNHNRLNRNNQDRLGWLSHRRKDDEKGAEIVYFVGCRSSFRRVEIAKNAYELLTKKLGIKITFIDDERCCGRPLLDLGLEDQAMALIRHNLQKIQKSGAKRVLFSCAECFHTFNSLERFGLKKDFEALHLSQYLTSLLADGALSLNPLNKRAAFHDPCYLGRHEGIYEAPRNLISSIPGVQTVELPRNRKNSWCCGAGGGVQEAFSDFSQWTANERLQEALHVKAETLVTACPGCKENLWLKASANQIEILDLAEFINRQLKG